MIRVVVIPIVVFFILRLQSISFTSNKRSAGDCDK